MTNLIRFAPFRDLDRVFEDDFFALSPVHRTPAVDLYQTDNEVVAEVSVPGIDPKKVHVEIENNILHIFADQEEVVEDKGKEYYRKEVRKGSFSRSMSLPVEVDAEKVSAQASNGVLTITMPKSEKAKPKKVSVEIK
jgi:HSP20 family protein